MGNLMTSKIKREKPELASSKVISGRCCTTANRLHKLPQVTPRKTCYLRVLKQQRIHDYLLLEREFIERCLTQEQRNEKRRKEEQKIEEIRGSPLGLARVQELFLDEKHAVVTNLGSKLDWYIPILSIADKSLIRVGSLVLVRTSGTYKNIPRAITGVLDETTDSLASSYKIEKAPKETFADIGGYETQIQELKEAIELPLSHPEYYEEMGIVAPRGVILYGDQGTGKTLLAKAVANATSACFIRVTASDFIRKTSGEGSKLVRDIFKLAKDSAPSIVFIDEIDAVGTKRYNTNSNGEQEIQRTLLELLNQLDGFDDRGDIKIIMATNRVSSLDPALIRPGRIDRKIEFPLPGYEARKKIFQIHTSLMNVTNDVIFEEIFSKEMDISGAEIKAICTEAGILALRKQQKIISKDLFQTAYRTICAKKDRDVTSMYG